ncbi:MAG: hypothetical protein RI965_1094 [Bacteroidota bacterium]|jgi:uncharacterized protein (TIGR02453 family)
MITASTIKFLKGLKKNNNKEWFDANRNTYENAKKEFINQIDEILVKLKSIDPTLVNLEPKNCVFRINRDVRFSANKEPYKTNFGASFSKGGKKVECAGYYFHLEPGNSFLGGGFWMPESSALKKIRMEIDYNFDEFKSILQHKSFKKYYEGLSDEEKLSRPPRDYDEKNPAIEFIKLKSFTALVALDDEDVLNKNLTSTVIKHFEAIQPLIHFLNKAID